MSKLKWNLILFLISLSLAQINLDQNLRSLKPKNNNVPPKKESPSIKEQTKLLQTLFTDSPSNNYYYTTLYIGDKKIKQTYLIDTGSNTFSSPCAPCDNCGKQKNNYFDPKYKKDPLYCESNICKMVPANGCLEKSKNINKKTCSFYTKKANGDGLSGYYLSNIVYFEEYTKEPKQKVYRSYALPLGCTLAEYGKYKNINVDGVMGINNDKGSFINVLRKLKIIDKDIFSLCFGPEGGYMALGEIDTKFHLENDIKYIPLVNTSNNYLFYIDGILVGNTKVHKTSINANIDTGSTLSYFPKTLYNNIYAQFTKLCLDKKGNNLCGNFKWENGLGYCTIFKNYNTLLKKVKQYWPTLTFELYKNRLYIWKPLNYYYYYFDNKINKPKACLGFLVNQKNEIILGQNFIHGHDVIFNLDKNILGFVPADCSRGIKNKIEVKNIGNITPEIKKPVPVQKPEINDINNNKKVENINTINNKVNIDKDVQFIKGKNKELDILSGPRLINFIILLIFGIIIVIALLIIIIILICKNKEYQKYQNLSINLDEIKKLNSSEQNIANEEANNISETKEAKDNEINNNIQESDNNIEGTKEDEKEKGKEKEKKKSIVESNLEEIQFLKKMMKKK